MSKKKNNTISIEHFNTMINNNFIILNLVVHHYYTSSNLHQPHNIQLENISKNYSNQVLTVGSKMKTKNKERDQKQQPSIY